MNARVTAMSSGRGAAPALGMAHAAADLVRLTKPRITLMVVVTGIGGIWLAARSAQAGAQASFQWSWLFGLLGLVLAVSSANALNMYIERDIDRHMSRTRNRPLPSGRLSATTALVFGLALGVASLPLLVFTVNTLTAVLAGISLFLYVLVYTPLKQRTPWAMAIGAIPGAMPPLLGWTTVSGSLDAGGLALFAVLFFWQLPHFLAISIFRHSEYSRAGIRVFPDVLTPPATRLHSLVYLVLLIASSLVLVPLGMAGVLYGFVAAALGTAFLVVSARGIGQTQQTATRWARHVFVASLVYLPLLVVAMVVGAG